MWKPCFYGICTRNHKKNLVSLSNTHVSRGTPELYLMCWHYPEELTGFAKETIFNKTTKTTVLHLLILFLASVHYAITTWQQSCYLIQFCQHQVTVQHSDWQGQIHSLIKSGKYAQPQFFNEKKNGMTNALVSSGISPSSWPKRNQRDKCY